MKVLKIISIPLLFVTVVGLLILLDNYIYKDTNEDTIYVGYPEDSPVELVGGGGERIYLKYGIIFAFKDDPDKEYDIVIMTFHVTPERFDKIDFFYTPEGAEAAGYKPSEDFSRDYECAKQGKDLFECWQENSE